jgi:superfamily II DNA/RNA helicase
MQDIEKIRILVGLNVDKKTIGIINQAEIGPYISSLSHREAKETFETLVEEEFAISEDSAKVEVGVKYFIAWLKNGKMEMRMYTDAPIHAKVYIMRKNMEIVPDSYGSVITGSSNFSEAGLKNNLEFNVELKDSRDVLFALERFEELWSWGIDIRKVYTETIETKTWLRNDITPYELYLKTLYEFFKEEINQDKDLPVGELMPRGYMQLQYQLDAVTQAKKTLEAYNGVFISDVVGLGKTYICALLAKSLRKSRKLVICPPLLVDYWERVFREFDVVARVVSLGKLQSIIDSDELDYLEYIFIDEAHRFRNQDTKSFGLLHQICYDKKIVLISATPINNYTSDIENQIYLFQPKHNSTIMPNEKNLEGFFRKLNRRLNEHERGTPAYLEQLRKNSEIIRDKLLRCIMIRRTRQEISDYYGKDLAKQGLSFPELGTPEKIIYTFDDDVDEVFRETMGVIRSLDYARYTPLLYLKDKKKYSSLMVSQRNLSGFMKSILVKRLESSFYAFKMTLGRFIYSYKQFIEMCKAGDVYISKEVNVYDLLDIGDDEKLLEMIEKEKVQHFRIDEFSRDFIPSLKKDLAMLERLKRHWADISVDPKLEQFKRELKNNNILKENKIIIFTESKETAAYLGDHLKGLFGNRLVVFSSESSEYLKKAIENSFNPDYEGKGEDRFDVLITTDVLAEGINLHRSNIVMNYDLPWNPTKIMQRVGRINRVGTSFKKLYVFNFFPTSQSNQHLPLKDRIIEKLQAFHDTLGEDFKYLSDDEQVTSHKLYDDLSQSLADDGEGTNPELAYLTVIRQVRDSNTDLFEKIKRLPVKSRSGKFSSLIDETATISFIRKGFLKMFLKTEAGNTEELIFMEAINFIRAELGDSKAPIGRNYFVDLNKNKKAFDDKLSEEKEIKIVKHKITGNDAKMIRILKAIAKCKKFTDDQDELVIKMRILWEDGEIPQALTKEILKDIRAFGDTVDELQLYHEIYDRIPERYFGGRTLQKSRTTGKRQIILSCFLRKAGI